MEQPTLKELSFMVLMKMPHESLLSIFNLHSGIKENVPSNFAFEEHLIFQLDLMTKDMTW